MEEDELRRAIERPAQLAGDEFEPGLVDVLLEEVKNRPGLCPFWSTLCRSSGTAAKDRG